MKLLKKLGEVIEKSQPENIILPPAIEHTKPHQPFKNNESVIRTELENTLKNMKKILGFLKQMKTQNMVGYGIVILLKY